jgi:antitoxin PrlF
MRLTAKITSKGQITIPAQIRRVLGVNSGDLLEFTPNGQVVQVKAQTKGGRFAQFRGAERQGRGKTKSQILAESKAVRGWSKE